MLTNHVLYRVALGKDLKSGSGDRSGSRPAIFAALTIYEHFLAAVYGINTSLIMAHFLAQTAAESNDFTTLEEGFNYSPQGLLATFGRHITKDQAGELGRHSPGRGGIGPTEPARQQKIANTVYLNRNGNTAPDDGFRFRGRGLIQLTGRGNYVAFASTGTASELGITAANIAQDQTLARFATPDLAVITAAWFWQSHGLNPLASHDNIYDITERVTGASDTKMDAIIDDGAPDTVSYHHRLIYLNRAKRALGVQ